MYMCVSVCVCACACVCIAAAPAIFFTSIILGYSLYTHCKVVSGSQ